MSNRASLPQAKTLPLVPISAEDFERERRKKIIKIVGPIAVGLILLALITWRVSLTSDCQTTFSEAQTCMQKGDFSHAEQRFAIVLREHRRTLKRTTSAARRSASSAGFPKPGKSWTK